MSANAYEVAGLLISAFGTGWAIGLLMRAYRRFFDAI